MAHPLTQGPFLTPTTCPLQVRGQRRARHLGGGDGASHFCRPQPPSLEGGEGLHSSPGGQKRRRAASPGRATTSLLSSSKECSRKETPVLCPLRGSLEAPHRMGVCVCTCGTATLSLSQVTCSRLKKVPLCVPSGRKAASCPALTEDSERWKLPQAHCDLSGPHSSSGTPAQPKIPHLPPEVQSKASPSVPYKNRSPVLPKLKAKRPQACLIKTT